MIIQGKFAQALCFAKVIEEEAAQQIQRMCDCEFAEGSVIRVMPDVHSGKGCTIGTTMTVRDKVVPNIVGVDIGCGMYTILLNEREIDLVRLDEAAHYIPSGKNVWNERKERFDLTQLRCFRNLKDTRRLERSLGTLGGGNHFIEADRASDGTLFLVIHTGSRNLGKQVAEYYQHLAVESHQGRGEEYEQKRDALIAEYKAAGRRKEIQKALKEIEWPRTPLSVPEELCWLTGRYLEDYLHDVALCQEYARINRELIAFILMERAGLTGAEAFHTIHNYIDTDEMILRKGAIAAHKGEKVLIPVNMRDGAILAVGRGNPDWNFSAPHGAGRILSRSAARQKLSMEEYADAMKGIYTTSVGPDTLDEAPMAYKPLSDIVDVVAESVDIIEIIKPIYNFKAAD